MKENDKFVEFANLNFNPCHDYNMTPLFLLTFPFCGRRVVYYMQKQLLDAIPYKSYGNVHRHTCVGQSFLHISNKL